MSVELWDSNRYKNCTQYFNYDQEGNIRKEKKLVIHGEFKYRFSEQFLEENGFIFAIGNIYRKDFYFLPRAKMYCLVQSEGNISNNEIMKKFETDLVIKSLYDNTFSIDKMTGSFSSEIICYFPCEEKEFNMYIEGNIFSLYSHIKEIGYYDNMESLTLPDVKAPWIVTEFVDVKY